jgi:HD-like signal output (HDOD) protein
LSGRELQLLIEGEPAVASQVIRLANTAYYKPYGPRVTNLRMALVRLGNRSVANLIETIAMSDFYQHGPDGAKRHLRQMWTNTLYSAIAARALATMTKSADPEDAYLLGLFHNVGEPLLIRLLAEEKLDGVFDNQNEQTLFGFMRKWHEPMGKRLLHSWSFPQTAVDLAGDHHDAVDSNLQALVCLSFESALSYGYSYFDHQPHDDRRTISIEKLGLDEEALNDLPTHIGTTLNEALGITTRL